MLFRRMFQSFQAIAQEWQKVCPSFQKSDYPDLTSLPRMRRGHRTSFSTLASLSVLALMIIWRHSTTGAWPNLANSLTWAKRKSSTLTILVHSWMFRNYGFLLQPSRISMGRGRVSFIHFYLCVGVTKLECGYVRLSSEIKVVEIQFVRGPR